MTDQLIPGDLLTRTKVITGLRQLADYLEDHPGVPVGRFGWDLNIYTDRAEGDAAARAEVDRIAALLGVTMNTYTHVLMQLRQDAADAIDEVLSSSSP